MATLVSVAIFGALGLVFSGITPISAAVGCNVAGSLIADLVFEPVTISKLPKPLKAIVMTFVSIAFLLNNNSVIGPMTGQI